MAYKRMCLPKQPNNDTSLTSNMAGIGMNFSAPATVNPNIEDTLLWASVEGIENEDLRTLSILTNWIGIHFMIVNVDRLCQIVGQCASEKVRAYWSAVATWHQKDRRFAKLKKLYDGPRVDLLLTGTSFQVKRFGEDSRFSTGPLRVPANALRQRQSDVLSPSKLASIHADYRWRTIIGPSYRADMWAALVANSSLSTSELARSAYGSFATAWKVKRDFNVVHGKPGIAAL